MATTKKAYLIMALVAVAVGALLGSGCAIRKGDQNYVKPLALDKAQFQGDWYFQKTIIDAPYDCPFAFPGAAGDGYKIRFEITEKFLFAFNTTATVEGTGSGPAPIAAWPIRGHFTIRYKINYATGEPSNVLGEDYVDKNWYERPHFRVDWGRSAVADYSMFWPVWVYTVLGYMRTERAVNVNPDDVKITSNYMDVVTEEIFTPLVNNYNFNFWIPRYLKELPMTSFKVKFRYSFKKAKPSTYTPLVYSDDDFEKFGYFRTAVVTRHAYQGLRDWSYTYYANRHNVATGAEIKAGSKKPKQIIYYLSADWPEKYKPVAKLIADSWDRSFRRALGRTDRVFVVHENDFGLPKGQKRNLGDIRYNFLNWSDKPTQVGILGYGPSFADPNTGEIVHATANIYGGAVRSSADWFLLQYDIVNGKYSDEDLRNGKDYLDVVNFIYCSST